MKKLTLLLLLFALTLPAAWAQENIFLEQVNQGESYSFQNVVGEDFFSTFSKLPLLADFQQAVVDANQLARINLEGDRNDAMLTQIGANNVGLINIKGNDNITSLQQDGNGLFSFLNILGDQNKLDMLQDGTALQNYVQVTGSGIDIDIQHNENGIRLTQTGTGAIPLQIESTGQTIPIIINNN